MSTTPQGPDTAGVGGLRLDTAGVGRPSPAVGLAKPAPGSYRRALPHYQRAGATLYVTFATRDRWVLPERVRDVVLDVILRGHGAKFVLRAAVVMPDHVHLLLTPQRDEEGNTFGMVEIMSGIKGASAHAVNRVLGRKGHVWQAESFDRLMRSSEDLREKAEYICQNPARAGIAASEDHYRWLWREWVEGTAHGSSE